MTPKNQLRSWYANGTEADCSRERANVYMCMRLKLARYEERARRLAENAERNRQEFEVPEGHFWKPRPHGVKPESWPEKRNVVSEEAEGQRD